MKNCKSRASQDGLNDLPYLATGDAAGLFIATYTEASRLWRHRGNLLLAQAQRLTAASGREPAAARERLRLAEDYTRALIGVADALDDALDADRPGDVAMLDLAKLDPAATAFGRMAATHDAFTALFHVAAGADNLASTPAAGHA